MTKILQANMHRGKVAHALLPQIVIEQETDIIVISEQYGRLTNGTWLHDDTETAAIWIPNNRDLKLKNNGKGNGFVWAQVESFTLVSCYLTPSDNVDEFQRKINGIEDCIRDIGGDLIVAGDFNARAVEWGMTTTNTRGRSIIQMAARVGLTVVNNGGVPTFRRPQCAGTIPDITLASERMAHNVRDWKVLEIYTGSDHQYISFSINQGGKATIKKTQNSTHKWNANKLDTAALIREIDRCYEEAELEDNATTVVRETMNIITNGCNKAMPKIKRPKNKAAVYWWNVAIDELRRNCIRKRRKYTRARRRSDAETEHSDYAHAKKELQQAIFSSKKEKWEELRNDINSNPWGLGYKIAMEKLGSKTSAPVLDEETMENIVNSLFPKHDTREEHREAEQNPAVIMFTEEELKNAARRLQNKKAPGPDGIPVEVMKEIANNRPGLLLNMYNTCLTEGSFPKAWKEQKLVLISKGKGDPNSPSSYRPLCMLDTAGKLLERLLKPRLEEAIRSAGGLSKRQYGFRPGKSTMGALKDVVDAVEASQQKNPFTRPVVLLATLDVRNAFNSLRWNDVLKALEEKFNAPAYLMRMLKDYLKDRVLIYSTDRRQKRLQVSSGAAQGSILGPDLWNASYDEILRIEMPKGTFLVGYADDIAAVIEARNTEEAQRRLTQVMIRTKNWLDSHGLQLASQKTELLLLTRKHIPTEIDMRFDDVVIRTTKSLKYLGIRLDPKLTYMNQIKHAANKAGKITAQLSRLMANIGGPLPSRRKLLMETCTSILLYGSEIWANTLRTKSRAKVLLSVQRTAALRVTSAYRTASESAVLVIAGMTPIDLQALERSKLWSLKQENQRDTTSITAAKQETLEAWQTRWNSCNRGRWTFSLIPNIEKWIKRTSGDVNYYLTQMLTGHGYFRKYLHKMGKCNTPFCIYEGAETIDDAEHTFFECCRWSTIRRDLETNVGVFSKSTITDIMTASDEGWNAIAVYVEKTLRAKKKDLDETSNS